MGFLSSGEDSLNVNFTPYGDLVDASATPHADGASVVLVASTGFEAAVLVLVCHSDEGGGGVDTSALLDVLVGGVEALADLSLGYNGPVTEFTIPLRIPAGSEVSVRIRSALASFTVDVTAYLYGGSVNSWAPSSWVTYGAVPSASRGTLFTAGDGSEGSWASLGTPAENHPAVGFRMGGGSDSTLTSKYFLCDLGAGATPTAVINDTSQATSGDPHTYESPSFLPVSFPVNSGEVISVRGLTSGATNNQLDAVAYGAAPEVPAKVRVNSVVVAAGRTTT